MKQNKKLSVKGICKAYPGTIALDDVSLDFYGGEVHALLGKNGAGKSTLVKIISGAVLHDRGDILLDGKKVSITNPRVALSHGIISVYQELSLVPGLTVAENLLLGRTPKKRILGIPTIDWKKTYQQSQKFLGGNGQHYPPQLLSAKNIILPVPNQD